LATKPNPNVFQIFEEFFIGNSVLTNLGQPGQFHGFIPTSESPRDRIG
jgi:hypothetical protein